MNICQNTEDAFMKHSCNICGKQIFTKKKLNQHQDEVHKDKGLKCIKGVHRVKSRRGLSQHIKIIHEGVKYPCRQCDHKAISNGNRARHERAVHEGVKYPCRQCDHKGTSKGILPNTKEQFMKG